MNIYAIRYIYINILILARIKMTFEEFDVNESDGISLRWTKWCHKIEKYITHLKLTNDKEKINELFLHGGYDLEQIYILYKNEDDTLANVIKKITDHFNPSGNVHLNRYKFREIQQQEGESFDEFTGRVKTSAKLCSFTDSDAECASQIIQLCLSATLKDKLLSAKTTPTLKELIEMGRLDESIQAQIKAIPSAAASSINQINTENRQHQSRNNNNSRQHHQSVKFSQQSSQARQTSSSNSKCSNSAYDLPHKTRDGACSAKGRECSNCGKLNHFAQACRQCKRTTSREMARHVPFHVTWFSWRGCMFHFLRAGVEAEIKSMLEDDLIEPVPGPTPWISPIVPVTKRNGTDEIRICTDARYANKAIKRERHVTPTVDDIVVKLNGAKFIHKMDLKKGYNLIRIAKESRFITAFCTHLGIYQTNATFLESTQQPKSSRRQSNQSSVASKEHSTSAMTSSSPAAPKRSMTSG